MFRGVPMIRLLLGVVLGLLPSPSWADRLHTSGFEENCTTTCMWSGTGGTAPTIGSTTPHSGTYRLDTAAGVGNSYIHALTFAGKTSGSTFTRFYFRSSTATPSADTNIYKTLSTGPADALQLSMLTTGAIRLINSVTATAATTTATLSADTWYRIEVRHLLSDTVGEMEARVYTDAGALIETVTITGEDTLPTNVITYRFGKTASTATLSYDDIAINNDSGAFQVTWPGLGKIYLLAPNSDTSITWENEAAGTATFTKIDDVPGAPDDATTYNTEIVNLNSIDRFGLTDPGAEIPADATITLVSLYGRVGSTQTAATNARWKIWDEAGTLTNGPTFSMNINGWKISLNTDILVYDATGKTKANLASFDAGYENITDVATRERRVSALWAEVEWTEAVGGGTASPQSSGWIPMLLGN